MTLPARATLLRNLALSATAIALAGTAAAQVHPDAKTGKKIAEKLCVGCHIVGAQAAGATVPADVPSFARIANKPGQTAAAIAPACRPWWPLEPSPARSNRPDRDRRL